MKKIAIYLLIFLIIFFIIPVLFTKKHTVKKTENLAKEETKTPEQYDYANFKTIKLWHESGSYIEELPLDEYLYGVVSAEMPASYETEALKAQAIVARTYTIYQITHSKNKHPEADICDDSKCCQAWISKENRLARWDENERENNWSKITQCVNETSGKIITYNNEPIDAFFHANSGGVTETASNVWGGSNLPYLQSVETSGEEGYSGYNTEVSLTKDELISKLKNDYSNVKLNLENKDEIKILEYTESGRVRTVKVGNTEIAGTKMRSLLTLRSTFFEVEVNGESVNFKVKGYGHGVGMSQTGADAMAKKGSTAEEIIKHFYSGVEVVYCEGNK